MTFPKQFGPDEIPPSVQTLLAVLLPQLFEGPHPALEALREQLRRAHVKEVQMTGAGFFVDFEVPPDAPLTQPRDLTGGSAFMELSSSRDGAGCVVFVRDGRLSCFEGYTYGETWTLDAQVTEIRSVKPISPDEH